LLKFVTFVAIIRVYMYVLLETYPVTVLGTAQVSRLLPIVVIHMITFVATDYFNQRTVFPSYMLRD
jgi:hypothetical protein